MNEAIKELLYGRDLSSIILTGIESTATKIYDDAYDKGYNIGYDDSYEQAKMDIANGKVKAS